MKFITVDTYEKMSRHAANIISAQVIIKPDCVLGLATGSSPLGTYKQLIDWYNKGDIDFSGVTSVNLDEYVGLDGHIGFNEPDKYFVKSTHVVNLHESTIKANSRFFANEEEVPKKAITMGMVSIMQAKKILLIANGKAKRDILEKAFYGPITPEIPASILQLHPDITVIYSEN